MRSTSDFDAAILRRLRSPFKGAMLFGSVARQSSSCGSDIDVMQLVSTPEPSYKDHELSVSVYSCSALREMAMHGDLFVLHLKLEGRVISDPEGLLQGCLGCYRQLPNYRSFLGDIAELSMFLDVSPNDYAVRAASLNHLAIFILRSTLYAILAERGNPRFAMEQVAESFDDPAILRAYSLKRMPGPSKDLFDTAKGLIKRYLRCEIHNPFGSYEALLLNCSRKSQFVRSVALHFLKRFSGEEAYGLFKHRLNESENHCG